jgi:hypothetical protein
MWLADLLLSERSTLRRSVEQSIADMREEHFDVLQQGNAHKANRIAIHGRISIRQTAPDDMGTALVAHRDAQADGGFHTKDRGLVTILTARRRIGPELI